MTYRIRGIDSEPHRHLFAADEVRLADAGAVRVTAGELAEYVDTPPPVILNRPLGLRAFYDRAMPANAALALPGSADAAVRAFPGAPEIVYIDAHNAAHGCFVARIERFAT